VRVTDDFDARSRLACSGDQDAEYLLCSVRAACTDAEDLPRRLEAGLRVALQTLAADPDLARRITVDPYLGGGDQPLALDAQREWLARFGAILREAVASDPRTTASDLSFLADFLIGGVRFRIARLVLSGEADDLLRLLPSLLEGLLSYYFEPGEPRRLARAALADRD
jgi:hypothetical protein